jgi:pilus assembly protein CpaE
MFEKLLFRHATGISLLAAPPEFDDVDSLTTRGVDRALDMARALFSQTVVDVEDCFHEEQLTALRQACGILLISRLDFTSLRNARRMLDHLQKHEVERRRIKVVINFHGQSNDLPMNEAQNALGEPLTRFVPYDPRTINSANNMGIPAALKNPATKLSKAIAELAKIDFESSTGAFGLLPTLRNIWKAIG